MGSSAALRTLVLCCLAAIAVAIPLAGEGATARRRLAGCGGGNPIDSCWMCDPAWRSHRQRLADCAIGFGRNAAGGRSGEIYVVTDSGNDNPSDPKYGTLRWGATRTRPLWIIFERDMTIRLEEELIVASYKTLDGRGADVHIANGACLTIQHVSNVIVHGINFHGCKSTGPARIMSSETHTGHRGKTDGDAINIFGSSNIWIDHNSFERCQDGLVDAIEGSDAITISNNVFRNHDKVMLLGAHDSDYRDKSMKVTICMNKFGEGLTQRMPRCRLGTFHIFNNFYSSGWGQYAIGGSGNPVINSENNLYYADGNEKEVTKHLDDDDGDWRSNGDVFVNGAFFTPSGASTSSPLYARARSFSPLPAHMVSSMIQPGPVA